MTAAELLASLGNDPMARLKWRVMQRLGICPVSLRARMMTRRQVLVCACHLALDAGGQTGAGTGAENPEFDMARFRALGGGI